MSFKDELGRKTDRVEEIVRKYLPKEEGYQATVLQAMNYSVTAGGKRLRPLLMAESVGMLDEKKLKGSMS